MGPICDTYWGSHGCDLAPGHDGPHQCGLSGDVCSQARLMPDGTTQVRHLYVDPPRRWGHWYEYGPLFRMDGGPVR